MREVRLFLLMAVLVSASAGSLLATEPDVIQTFSRQTPLDAAQEKLAQKQN